MLIRTYCDALLSIDNIKTSFGNFLICGYYDDCQSLYVDCVGGICTSRSRSHNKYIINKVIKIEEK